MAVHTKRTLSMTKRGRQQFFGVYYLVPVFLVLIFSASCATVGGQTSNDQYAVQQVPKSRLTYVAIGASDTFGIGADDPQTESWPVDLAAKFGSDIRLV